MTAADARREAVGWGHVLVRASAGSGKTFRLTVAFIGHVLRGEAAGSLLATTFTRAAAGEVLHRVLSRLSDAVLDGTALAELRAFTGVAVGQEDAERALERLAVGLHRLSVLTIDAWFARLVGAFVLELGLPPGWRTLDEEELEDVEAAAVGRALADADVEQLVELLRDLQGESAVAHAHAAMLRVVREGLRAMHAAGDVDAAWEAVRPTGGGLDEAELSAAVATLAGVALPSTKAGKPDKRWAKGVQKVIECVGAGDWRGLLEKGLGEKVLAGASAYSGRAFTEESVAALEPLVRHAGAVLTREHAARTAAMRRLTRAFGEGLAREKRAAGAVAFDDLPRLLAGLESEGESASAAMGEGLYFRLDGVVRHVLLDEFQDTSLPQFRLLEPMLDELLSQSGAERSVFCVGDVKQSLYQWREAEPGLLGAMRERWPVFGEERLSTSYRSSPAVIDAVNAVFGRIATNAALGGDAGAAAGAAAAWAEGFERHEEAERNAALAGEARLTVARGVECDGKPKKAELARALLESAVERVLAVRERAPGATVAVLVRDGKHIAAVLGLLKRKGVEATERRGNPLVDAPAVAAAVSLLRFVEHPGHTAGLYYAARTPLGAALGLRVGSGWEEAGRAFAASMRRRVMDESVSAVLRGWFALIVGHTDARGAARFEQLIALAEGLERRGERSGTAVARAAERRRVEEPGGASVRVMTVHGSKGLEFDAVVLPLTGERWSLRSGGVVMEREGVLGEVRAVTRYPNEVLRAVDPELARLHGVETARMVNGELCCLYVAMTRAKRSLEMIVPAEGGEVAGDGGWKPNAAHVVRAALAPEREAEAEAVLWERALGTDWRGETRYAAEGAEAACAGAGVELAVREPASRETGRLLSTTPTGLGGRRVADAAALLRGGDGGAREAGLAVHAFFERVGWIEEGEPNDVELVEAAMRVGVRDSVARDEVAGFRRLLRGAAVQRVLSRARWLACHPDAERASVETERPFAVRDGAGGEARLLRGRFDRVIVGRRGEAISRVEVVDVKTSGETGDLTREALVELAVLRSGGQLSAYRRAAASLFGVDVERVGVSVLFSAAGSAVDVTGALEG